MSIILYIITVILKYHYIHGMISGVYKYIGGGNVSDQLTCVENISDSTRLGFFPPKDINQE